MMENILMLDGLVGAKISVDTEQEKEKKTNSKAPFVST